VRPALIQVERQVALALVIPSGTSSTGLIVRSSHKVHLLSKVNYPKEALRGSQEDTSMTTSPAELFDELEEHYPYVIEQMEFEFTSHQFIKKLSQMQLTLYIQLLSIYNEKGPPFQAVHSVIAQRLKNNWKHMVAPIDTDTKSENISGSYNSGTIWHKVKS
jgi:hypothetical protein